MINVVCGKKKSSLLYPCIILTVFTSSCKKFIEVDAPNTALSRTSVYTSNSTASAAMTGVYGRMSNTGLSGGNNSIGLQMGLSADELTNYYSANAVLTGIYKNALSSLNKYYWTEIFQEIYAVNAILEGLASSSQITGALKTQLTGEAKFMRAFLHFYSVNIYGDVPIVLTTDYRINNTITRSAVDKVLDQIIADLLDAKSMLGNDYVTGAGLITSDHIRPNKWAATALLARVYLYKKDWADAESIASLVINNSLYTLEPDLNTVFLKTSKEAIWQFQPLAAGVIDAKTYILTATPSSNNPVALSPYLLAAFENGDARFNKWVGQYSDGSNTYFYPNKYKQVSLSTPTNEYSMVLRLAEQYLIRAEARAEQNNISGAQDDLNKIRNRAGLTNTTANNKDNMLSAILHERQVELFTEWGHRWFDLKRTGTIDAVMEGTTGVTQAKGGTWNTFRSLFPIPQAEILINPNLTQNSGYQ